MYEVDSVTTPARHLSLLQEEGMRTPALVAIVLLPTLVLSLRKHKKRK